jgi:parallel beta-helix repeat protein
MKRFSGLMLTLLITSMLAFMFNVQSVKGEWTGTVYIRADGSIDPPDAPIITYDKVTYTLTYNITSTADGIVVERDNIVLDGEGYTVQGNGSGIGVLLEFRSNVTITNMEVNAFDYGIRLRYSSNNIVCRNNITNNGVSILLDYSLNNSIVENTIANNWHGIRLDYASYNIICGNNITANKQCGARAFW